MECLDGLEAQSLQPLEVLAVVRNEDHQSLEALAHRRTDLIKVIEVEGGFLSALNAGLASASGEVVAFTDDDAVPRPDWLARINDHFLRDRGVGAVGGRDLIAADPGPPAPVVGRVTWYGRVVGGHHQGVGSSRPVDVLKGVNLAVRAAAVEDLQFDNRLAGRDMAFHSEIGFCLAIQRSGWKLIYDPAVLVDHNPAIRPYGPQRDSETPSSVFMESHNILLGLATGLSSWRRVTAVAFSLIVGTRNRPGPLLALERMIVGREGWAAVRRMRAATAGRIRALSTALRPGVSRRAS